MTVIPALSPKDETGSPVEWHRIASMVLFRMGSYAKVSNFGVPVKTV